LNAYSRRRARVFAAVLILWGAALLGRLVQVQLAQGDKYRARADRQQQRRIKLAPPRGSILDREGRELAVSMECSSVFAIPEEVSNPRAAARRLASLLDVPESVLFARLTQPKGFVWLARKIDASKASRVKAWKLAGVHLVTETKRFYPKGPLAAAVLGYVGTDDKGLAGLEHLYDEAVRGRPGEIVAWTDARRSTYGEAEAANGAPPREGATLVLSIDSGIQFAAERELAAALDSTGARSGSVVVLDPSTGDILAMASAPGFDPNRFGLFPPESRRNHAIADAHEPGSTFKIVTGAVALEDAVVRTDEIIETGDGTIRVGDTTISEHEHKRFGPLTLAGVFEHSSNVGIIRVGLRLGARRLYQGAAALGVGRPTGVDLPGESQGIFRPLSRWSGLSPASIAMGQEVAMTALQIARVAGAVANGGLLVTPRLVTKIEHPGGSAQEMEASPPARVFSKETARKLSEILVGVVERGTGTLAAVPGFAVAGKTGTAQKAGPGGYQPGRYVISFVGFAPAERPRVVCAVLIEEPRCKRYYASEVAAPVFSRVVSQALAILRVAPDGERLPPPVVASAPPQRYPAGVVPVSLRPLDAAEREQTAASDHPKADMNLAPGSPKFEIRNSKFEISVTPNARGLSAREALALFARAAVTPRLVGSGFVVTQNPRAGSRLSPGQTHVLTLAESVSAALPASRRAEEIPPALAAP